MTYRTYATRQLRGTIVDNLLFVSVLYLYNNVERVDSIREHSQVFYCITNTVFARVQK